MKYDKLDLSPKKSAKRVGRGIASGKGKTAGRGTKGQGARAGSTRRPGFSGGQNPLMQQLPKLPGFKSHFEKAELVFIDQLDDLKKKIVDNYVLFDAHLISTPHSKVKLLHRGELKSSVSVKLQGASAQAVDALTKAGGVFEKVNIVMRPAKKKVEDK
jgi:large subunit ribosomal protein L15